MRIGLISDTHGSLSEFIHEEFDGVDYIIHAGDIGKQSILWELEAIAPTIAVLGNNDWQDYGSSVRVDAKTIIGGARIYVTHYPEDAVRAAKTGEYDLCVHGHTHTPRDIYVGSCRIINPGSATRPRGGSKKCAAVLDVADGVTGTLRTVLL